MYTPEAQGSRPAAAPSRRLGRNIGGVALMLLGVALMAWGAHHLTENGTCSNTGYVSYGPVPTCKGNEFLYITSAFFLGPAVAGVGWLMAQISGLMWPITCIGLGVSLFTIRNDVGAAPGAKAFGMLAGVSFAALAVLSVIVTLRKRHRKTASGGITHAGIPGPAIAPGPAAPGPAAPGPAAPGRAAPGPAAPGPATMPVVSAPPSWGVQVAPAAAGSGSDPFDKIAKLAQLRDTGALTDTEFQREKAKLLNEI
jgi:uncharacterized membrane protein